MHTHTQTDRSQFNRQKWKVKNNQDRVVGPIGDECESRSKQTNRPKTLFTTFESQLFTVHYYTLNTRKRLFLQ